jgi:2-amino-4-hydroxy-6-hydroxymethyldihydropteridine diphosphokinase
MATALVSLGSNVGDRAAMLGRALALMGEAPSLRVAATSAFHETRPAGGPAGQQNFLNAAALLETSLPPRELVLHLQNVETKLGRVRGIRWGPRTIDLDLLLYDLLELESSELTLPHPRMSFRRFVLEPAVEIAADMMHPVCGNTMGGLLRHLDQSPRYVAIEGLSGGVVRALRRHPHLVIAAHGHAGDSVHEAARLLEAIHRLEHGQWLVGQSWGSDCARFADPCSPESPGARNADASPARQPCDALVQPRLLVVLPAGGEPLRERRNRLSAQVRQGFRGPTLWLTDEEPEHVAEEVLAAMQAME